MIPMEARDSYGNNHKGSDAGAASTGPGDSPVYWPEKLLAFPEAPGLNGDRYGNYDSRRGEIMKSLWLLGVGLAAVLCVQFVARADESVAGLRLVADQKEFLTLEPILVNCPGSEQAGFEFAAGPREVATLRDQAGTQAACGDRFPSRAGSIPPRNALMIFWNGSRFPPRERSQCRP